MRVRVPVPGRPSSGPWSGRPAPGRSWRSSIMIRSSPAPRWPHG